MALTLSETPLDVTTTGTYYFQKPQNATAAFLTVSGTYGTLAFTVQGSYDSLNAIPVVCYDNSTYVFVTGATSIAPSDNAEYGWIIPCENMVAVGINVSSLASGTATFTLTTGSFVGSPVVASQTVNTTTSGNVSFTGTATITSASASALTVGANGATNPVLKVNDATSSVATGIQITGAAAASGVAIAAISSGTNENLTVDAKGSGTVTIGNSSTGNVVLTGGGGIVVVKGTLTAGGLLTCAVQVATSGPLIYSGSGAPSINAAVKGSLYLRTDGSSGSTRAYIATDTAGAWAAITTAS